jgi:deoxyribodipyrimidine photo-lyase
MQQTKITIFWHRRDLRLEDNAGLYRALKAKQNVVSLFIFDKNILDKLEDKKDARVQFIHDNILRLKQELQAIGSDMLVFYGQPIDIWQQILSTYEVEAVFTNRDWETYAQQRDEAVKTILSAKQIPFYDYKDHLIFDKNEVLKDDGKPYTVFSPYARKWMARLDKKMSKYTNANGEENDISYYLKPYPTTTYFHHFIKNDMAIPACPSLSDMGFEPTDTTIPSQTVATSIIKNYDKQRNFPAILGTSRLGIHFRFGTISIREKALKALYLNQTYLNELIWRDFYAQILAHFPHVQTNAFRKEYELIAWRNNEEEFDKWCKGKTGYPIVDAGMRELNTTGYMHNRVRMIVASFLTKHLLMDWRLGEAYFAKKLIDFDLASNNGGWQWAAGCGTDAAPYFRLFNPEEQMKKFDGDKKYVKQWVPEYGTIHYVKPIVEHKFARERCLTAYKEGLAKSKVM